MSDYFITSDKLDKLESALENAKQESVSAILQDFHHQSQDSQLPFSLEPYLETIDQCFGADSVSECLDSLPSNDFGSKSRSILEQMSPLAMKATMKHIRNPYQSLIECLRMDYRLAYRMCRSHDFIEGVSALLIDKNRKPTWKPSKLDEISDSQVDKLFDELPPDVDEFIPLTQK